MVTKYNLRDKVLIPAEITGIRQYYCGEIIYYIRPINAEPDEETDDYMFTDSTIVGKYND